MSDFRYEHFNSIYDFENAINTRPVNEYFQGDEHSKSGSSSFTATESLNEADELMLKGWNAKVEEMKKKINFQNKVERLRNKQIKNVAGYAPCVPNAIKGVPKSMIATKVQRVEEKRRTMHLVINNTGTAGFTSTELMNCGMTVLKLAQLLDANKIRTRIDVVPKMSYKNDSLYGCTVKIKDYKQNFNLSKVAYPLGHVSFFRRHGFRYFETLPNPQQDFSGSYGTSDLEDNKQLRDKYFEFAGFLKNNVIYIDKNDCFKANFDPVVLAKNKGITLDKEDM